MNDTLRFNCSACGKRLKYTSALAGRSTRCPKCGHRFALPPVVAEAVPPVPPLPQPPEPPAPLTNLSHLVRFKSVPVLSVHKARYGNTEITTTMYDLQRALDHESVVPPADVFIRVWFVINLIWLWPAFAIGLWLPVGIGIAVLGALINVDLFSATMFLTTALCVVAALALAVAVYMAYEMSKENLLILKARADRRARGEESAQLGRLKVVEVAAWGYFLSTLRVSDPTG